MFVGTRHPFCLQNSGIQCSFVVIAPQREAADTRSQSGEDVVEALTESTPPVHPEVCSGCNFTIKTHVTCVGPAVATSDWESPCAGHCQWHCKRTVRCFIHFWNCFFIVVLVQFRRTPSRSSAPCQTLTTKTMRSWKAVAKANSEHSKRTNLGATCFERVCHFLCLISALPDSPRKRRIVELDPWKAPRPPGLSPFEQACALNFGDD